MNKIKSFKKFNEALVYDEDFNEYILKNMLSGDSIKSEVWSLISDLIQVMKQHDPDNLSSLRNELMHDNKDSALKIATKYALALGDKAQRIIDKLFALKSPVQDTVTEHLKLKVKNILQAEDLKNILESKPWYSKVKVEGHNLLVDLKNNTKEQISNLLKHLPFTVTIL